MRDGWPVMLTANREDPPVANRDHVASLLAGWADAAHGTLPQQLARAVRRAVQSGMLPDGYRLPPERAMAAALSISRSTVTAALDELRADGTVRSRQGSGTTVRNVYARALAGTRIAEHLLPASGIDLAAGNPPDPSHLPAVQVDVAAMLAGGDGPGVQPLGLAALRTALAERHRRNGQPTEAAEIHVTSGAHQAVALAVGALTDHNAPVAVEDVSYPGIFDIIDALGARAAPIRTDRAGLVPEALDEVLAEQRPAVLYVQAGPHNPTGRVPAPGRLRAIAAVLDRYGTTAIEDCALADLAFAGRQRPELAELCRRAAVVSTGSFSKVAWGGLRIGWLRAAAPFIERTMYLRLANDLGPSVPSQLLALQLLPHLDELADQRRSTLASNVNRATEVVRRELPTWHVDDPDGGSVLWARLPLTDCGAYVLLAGRHGVQIAPGSIANATRSPDPHVRICVDRPWPIVEEGINRLRVAWHELNQGPRPVLG